jgi:hypothetical protein
MVTTETWVFLVYRMPRQPSTPRISVWRRLKRLGVAQLGDGLVALPYDAATKEQLEWVAHTVAEAGGEATIWITTPTARRFGRDLAAGLAGERAKEYREVIRRTEDALASGAGEPHRMMRTLRAMQRRIERRDHFPPPERVEARSAIDRLAIRFVDKTTV